jgi:hemerythrin-like metal-binding protein
MDTIGATASDINIDSIDITKEHDELRRLIDRVYALMAGEPTGKDYINEIIAAVEDIRVVFSLHCEHEELVMHSTHCAGINEHQQYHCYIQQTLTDFASVLKAKLFPITSNTASYVKQWLSLHIMKHDVDFRNKHNQ